MYQHTGLFDMALTDLLSRVSRPGGKSLDAPIRAIVHEVLKEQGYASPAEVQALRDQAADLRRRLDGLDGKVAELVKLLELSRTDASAARAEAGVAKAEALAARQEAQSAAKPAPPPPDPRVAELAGRVAKLQQDMEGRAGTSVAAQAPPAPLTAAPRGSCKVPDCAEAVRSKGFCSAHYQQWRRGTLDGFVGLDGTFDVEGKVVNVGTEHAGESARVDGGRVLVNGKALGR